MKYIINPDPWKLKKISEYNLDSKIQEFTKKHKKARFVSVFTKKKDVLDFLKELGKKPALVTKGFKRFSEYDVFHS